MAAAVPVVRVMGPTRNIGKTWLASRLIEQLTRQGYRVAAIKSSHHSAPEDRAGSDTALLAAAGALPVIFAAGDGTLIRGAATRDLSTLVAELPPTVDVALVEGFKADPLGARIEIIPGAPESRVRLVTMDGRPEYEGPMSGVVALADALRCVLGISASGSEQVRTDIRLAARAHGHRCPGLTLGVRMARYAACHLDDGAAADAALPLLVEVETARCATDAIAAVTGCTTGNGRLRVKEYGKLAATFSRGEHAVRVAARSGLRELATLGASCAHSAHAQDEAYRTLADDALFDVHPAVALAATDRHPGGHRLCSRCLEEVAGWAIERTSAGDVCRACAAVRTSAFDLVAASPLSR
ncbi:MAG: molybdopterin-guanine dinucleotide biosynthesis protein MobB [Dehalococcoidia bacterium]